MIIVRLQGGLGNQLIQYSTGYSLAMERGDSRLFFDTGNFKIDKKRSLELNNFDLPLQEASYIDLIKIGSPSVSYLNKIIHKLHFSNTIFPNYEKEKKTYSYAKFPAYDQIYIDGYWQNLDYFNKYRKQLINLLRPKKKFSKKFDNILKLILNADNSVSLHIRRGDYINDPITKARHYVCDNNYYLNAIDLLNKKLKNPIFFIFSDDIDWCKDFLSNSKDYIFVQNTSNIEDFELMRNCKSNIISNSSFSWCSSYFSYNKADKNSYTIFPKYWLSDIKTSDINLIYKNQKECIQI